MAWWGASGLCLLSKGWTTAGQPPSCSPAGARGGPPVGSLPLLLLRGGARVFGVTSSGGSRSVSLCSRGSCALPAGGEPPVGVSPLVAGPCRPSVSRFSTCVSQRWYHSGWSSFSICCRSSVAWSGWLPLGSLLTMSSIVMCFRGLPTSSRWGRKVRSHTLLPRRGGSAWYCIGDVGSWQGGRAAGQGTVQCCHIGSSWSTQAMCLSTSSKSALGALPSTHRPVPHAGADAGGSRMLPTLAASTESRTLLLLCTLLHSGSLTLAPCAPACVLAQLRGPAQLMPLASWSSQRRLRHLHSDLAC